MQTKFKIVLSEYERERERIFEREEEVCRTKDKTTFYVALSFFPEFDMFVPFVTKSEFQIRIYARHIMNTLCHMSDCIKASRGAQCLCVCV